ncbi:MAG: cyclase family protein [Fuerstiella sp.]|nr:cyclase family protein [Fuerstiella sp.]
MNSKVFRCLSVVFVSLLTVGFGVAQVTSVISLQKWEPGRGWGWVWGPDDEVGALNEMTDASRLTAVRMIQKGKTFDLGITYDRNSFKWPGHSPGEIITFRSPEGVKRQGDFLPALDSARGTTWHSSALFINDNVATQIDGLGHAVEGDDNHWYNGFREEDWGGNWGPRKCDAVTIPPVVARGVLIDVAGAKGTRALPAHYEITSADLRDALAAQRTKLHPGDVVLIRTGAIQFWEDINDRELLAAHDTAGLSLEAAQWLVEQNGAMMIGSDTSGLEYWPRAENADAHRKEHGSFMPVHNYLLIEQGVHIAEFHYLEELAATKTWEFCYICTTAKIRGTTAGFALRPIAMR